MVRFRAIWQIAVIAAFVGIAVLVAAHCGDSNLQLASQIADLAKGSVEERSKRYGELIQKLSDSKTKLTAEQMAQIEKASLDQAKKKITSAEEREQQWSIFAGITGCLIDRGHEPTPESIAFLKHLSTTKATVLEPEPDDQWGEKYNFGGASRGALSRWGTRKLTREILAKANALPSQREKISFLVSKAFVERIGDPPAENLVPAILNLGEEVLPVLETEMLKGKPTAQIRVAKFLTQYYARHKDTRSLKATLVLAEKGRSSARERALKGLSKVANEHAKFVSDELMRRWQAGQFNVDECEQVFMLITLHSQEEKGLAFLSKQLTDGDSLGVRHGAAMAMASKELGMTQLKKNLMSGNTKLKWISATGMLRYLSRKKEWDATDKRILADLHKFVGKEKGQKASSLKSFLDEMVDERKRRN